MEGSEGGEGGRNLFFAGYRPISKRWEDYVKLRRLKGMPVVGSVHLFTKLWKAHKVRSSNLSTAAPTTPALLSPRIPPCAGDT